MTINKYRKAFFLAAVLLAGCGEKLELEPAQSLSTDASLADFKGFETALVGAYDGLQSVNYYGRNFYVAPEVRGDNVYVSTKNSNRFISDYNYQLTTAGATLNTFWSQAYAVILRVNNVINRIDGVPDAPSQAAADQIKGEALGLRALVYFDLLRVYALPYSERTNDNDGVPLVLEAQLGTPPRDTQEKVYTQILADLTSAKSLMSDNSVGPYRFTDAAADALMARVHLYMENYAAAEAAATAVINAGFALVDDPADLFAEPGTEEEIFTLHRLASETAGSDNLGSIYNPPPNGYGDIRVTEDLRNLYAAGDERAELFYPMQTPSGQDEYFVGKFIGELGVPGLTSTKILRLGEMYLIRAEARAAQNNNSGAIADLNVIRQRAGVAALGTVDPADLMDEIATERRRELAFEGHRSFDIWRTGEALQRIQCGTGLEISTECSIPANSGLRVYPIPQAEINTNPNIVQNDAYK